MFVQTIGYVQVPARRQDEQGVQCDVHLTRLQKDGTPFISSLVTSRENNLGGASSFNFTIA